MNYKTNLFLKIRSLFIWCFIFCVYALPLCAQTLQIDTSQLLKEGKFRDQKAIDDAVNGWWTASMKNHDQRIQWWREAKFGMFIH